MKKSIAGLCLVLSSSFAWALPTVEQVEAEVGQGHYAQAETMMAEVVAAKPGSAKAHYFYAEILAHNANYTKASEETAKSRQLDPKIGFTDPAKFATFEQTLQREQNPATAPRTRSERPASASTSSLAPAMSSAPMQAEPAARTGLPGWVWLVGLVLLAVVVWKMFSRNGPRVAGNMATAGGPGAYNGGMGGGNMGPAGFGPNNGPNYGPGYGPGNAPVARPGGGLLGTGLAVAGGVAGGMLLDEALRHRSEGGGSNNFGGFEPGNGQTSGADQAASDLENRQVDFGNGGDWDSGGGGSGDSGGGDSGGGWD